MHNTSFATVLFLLICSCVSKPDAPCRGDEDGDGYLPEQCATTLAIDCDDQEESVHPGAVDTCGNDIDEACVGRDLACSLSISGNTSRRTDTGLVVENGAMRMEFGTSGANSNPAPIHLSTVGGSGENLLYQGPMDEKLIGVLHFISTDTDNFASWNASGSPVPWDDSWVEENGPVVVRLRIPWEGANDNGDNNGIVGLLSGSSVYTLYPDGRVFRSEEFSPTTAAQTDDTYVVAYVALDGVTAINRLLSDQGQTSVSVSLNDSFPNRVGDPFYPEFGTTSNVDDLGYLCAYHTETKDRVGWSYKVTDNGQQRAGPRGSASALSDEERQVALQYDWVRAGTVDDTQYTGIFLLQVGTIDEGQQVNPCQTVAQQASAFNFPARISSTPPAVFHEDGGYYELAGANQSLQWTISQTTDQTLLTSVYQLSGLDLTHMPTIHLRRNNEQSTLVNGQDYLLQPSAQQSGTWWLYIARPLFAGDQLTMTAP